MNERNTLADIIGFLGDFALLAVVIVVVVVIAIVAFIYIRSRYKIASANEALVITGGKGEPKILVGGGAFIAPFRKGAYFDLGLKTVGSTNDATFTSTMIPVVVEWTAQLRADTSKDDKGELNISLRNAILGFTDYNGDVSDSLQQTLEGDVRAVIGDMTPEDLVRNKVGFAERVNTNVSDSMRELGYKLVSLNIGKISDPNGYYDNLAAKDREAKRSESANLKATADQGIAVAFAEADEASKAAQQKRDLAVAEQARALGLRNSAIKAETDIANADAEIAGELQRELRGQELAQRVGQVEVIREEQRQAAALARREVEVTEAETSRKKQQIEAEAQAEQSKIRANASAEVKKRESEASGEAATIAAQTNASAVKIKAEGDANAINLTTEARSSEIRQTGLAQAEVDRAQGEAQAAAILAKGSAEAEAQRLMAEALAANEGANLRVTLATIESQARVTIYTETAKVMAEVGKNAKFVDMGGGSTQGGDLLSRVMGNIPTLLNNLDVKSEALNDTSFGSAIGSVIAAIKDGAAADASTSVETPTPAPDAPQSSDASKPEPVAETVKPVDEPIPSAAALIGWVDENSLDIILEMASSEGATLVEFAAKYGVTEEALQTMLLEKFTASELREKGVVFSKKPSGKDS